MAHRTRLAPPPDKAHLPTKLAGSAFDVERLIAQGWTIVQSNGEASIDIPEGGASTDPPTPIAERIEQVLGEQPRKKRPRIIKPAQA